MKLFGQAVPVRSSRSAVGDLGDGHSGRAASRVASPDSVCSCASDEEELSSACAEDDDDEESDSSSSSSGELYGSHQLPGSIGSNCSCWPTWISRRSFAMTFSSLLMKAVHMLSVDDVVRDSQSRLLRSKWEQVNSVRVMIFGSKLILTINAMQYLWILFGLALARVDCEIYPFLRDRILRSTRAIFFIIFFNLSTVGFVTVVYRPRVWLYMTSLITWCLVVMGCFMFLAEEAWNFKFSCGGFTFSSYEAEIIYEHHRIHLGSSLKGYCILETNMIVILLLPWIVPYARFLPWNLWAWTLIFYVYAAVSLRCFMDLDIFMALTFMTVTNLFALHLRRKIDNVLFNDYEEDQRQEELSKNLLRILRYMVPEFVLSDMLRGGIVAEHMDQVSILFIMLDKCDEIARTMPPEELLCFLNEHFTAFDLICAAHDVTKIETVGAEYVCAVGVSPQDRVQSQNGGHRHCLGRLVEVAREVLALQHETPTNSAMLSSGSVVCRMGVHTGPVIGGIVGQKLPRFRLFGDTINTAARMMQKGLPGEVQFGVATREQLPEDVKVTQRGEIEMKGKGKVMTYLLWHPNTRRATYSAAHGLILDEPPGRPKAPAFSRAGTLPRLSNTAMNSVGRGELRRCQSLQGCALACLAVQSETEADPKRRTELRIMDATQSLSSAASRSFSSAVHDITQDSENQPAPVRCSVLSFPDPNDEAAFRDWYIREFVFRDAARRSTWWLTASACITTIEIIYMYLMLPSVGVRDFLWELRTYLSCRFVVFVIQFVWLFYVPRCPASKYASRGLIASWFVGLFLAFLSYDSTPIFQVSPHTACMQISKPPPALCGICSNVVLLFFLPIYVLGMTESGTLFHGSFIFPLLSIVIVACETVSDFDDPVFHNWVFRVVLVVRSLAWPCECYLKERALRMQFKSLQKIHEAQGRIHGILETLMPPLVLKDLSNKSTCIAQHPYRHATIAQSDLCGFTELASTRRPEEVVEFISDLFGLFDELTDTYEIYKLETVGDAYIAGQAEAPLTVRNSPMDVVRFALAMVEATHEWSARRGEAVSCRVGVHSGQCVGGIVGNNMQRYHLFGELMSTLEVLESTAPRGEVQVSKACRDAVDAYVLRTSCSCSVAFTLRDVAELRTSKGERHTFDEVGGGTYIAFPSCPE